MKLKTVTITGADDNTDIQQMMDLSAEFPFVEWGILISKKRSVNGFARYPSYKWVELLISNSLASKNRLHISTHVCGSWVKDMLVGDLDWRDLPWCYEYGQRIQINTHGEPHVSTTGLLRSLFAFKKTEFIFQWDGVNNLLPYAVLAYGCKVSALFDRSGGAGVLPDRWERPSNEFWCGYAGGLGPDNVVDQVKNIELVCDKPYWIDMETRVRTADDKLDMNKVREVLESMKPFVAV